MITYIIRVSWKPISRTPTQTPKQWALSYITAHELQSLAVGVWRCTEVRAKAEMQNRYFFGERFFCWNTSWTVSVRTKDSVLSRVLSRTSLVSAEMFAIGPSRKLLKKIALFVQAPCGLIGWILDLALRRRWLCWTVLYTPCYINEARAGARSLLTLNKTNWRPWYLQAYWCLLMGARHWIFTHDIVLVYCSSRRGVSKIHNVSINNWRAKP